VIAIGPDGLVVHGPGGREVKVTRKHRHAFEVGRSESLALAAGDRLLIRGRDADAGLTNGEIKTVAQVDAAADRVVLTDGRELPRGFAAWTYGHALTSYRAQGSTAEESLLVLGEVAARALARRQFYVGNTRYRGAHAIYLTKKEELLHRLARPDPGRELATEFMARHRLVLREQVRRGWRDSVRHAWRKSLAHLRAMGVSRADHREA
jgi:ATP-dependent exoDNAse (exonuclease V) alpha subunit